MSAIEYESARFFYTDLMRAKTEAAVAFHKSVENWIERTVFHNAYKYDATGKLAGRKKAFLVEVRSDRYKGLGWYAGWELAHPCVPVVNVTLGHGYTRRYPAHTVFPAAPGTKVPYELARVVLPHRRLAGPKGKLP